MQIEFKPIFFFVVADEEQIDKFRYVFLYVAARYLLRLNREN